MDTRIHVVVGILYNNNKDKVLITKRISGKFLAGYWEFPGGKVKNNEDSFSALSREFDEELGIIIKTAIRKERSLNYAAKKSKSKTTLVNVSVEGVSLISVPVVSLFPVALSLALGTPSE